MEFSEEYSPTAKFTLKVDEILFRKKSKHHWITIFENRDFGRVLALNNEIQTTTRDEYYYHEAIVHPVMISGEVEKVLIIGGGDGGALREVLKHQVEDVLMVEIDEEVVKASRKYLKIDQGAFEDRRLSMEIADGFEFVRESKERFDVTILDLPDPNGKVRRLFTEEFYSNLRTKGVSLQAGSMFYNIAQYCSIFKTLEEVFGKKEPVPYLSPVPSYPGGVWGFFLIPIGEFDFSRMDGIFTRFYDEETHRFMFSIPKDVRLSLNGWTKKMGEELEFPL